MHADTAEDHDGDKFYRVPLVATPIGGRSALFFMWYFSSLARICLPYVYLRSTATCGRILLMSSLRCGGSATSIIRWTT